MADENTLLAVQLANQRLSETTHKMEVEVNTLRTENAQLREENARLQKSLEQLSHSHDTIKQEYQQATGSDYTGRRQTSMFGFGKNKK
ncbi:MAG: regulator of replication initiation timing [Candidatus Latescibacterota bacterium]|jgi:regulator of replication initiation timing